MIVSECKQGTRTERTACGTARTGRGAVSFRARPSESVEGAAVATVSGCAVLLYPPAGGWDAFGRKRVRREARAAGVALFVAERNGLTVDELRGVALEHAGTDRGEGARGEARAAGACAAAGAVPYSDTDCTAYLAVGEPDALRAMWACKYVGRVEFPGNATYFGRTTQRAERAGPKWERPNVGAELGAYNASRARALEWVRALGVSVAQSVACGLFDALQRFAYAHPDRGPNDVPAADELKTLRG